MSNTELFENSPAQTLDPQKDYLAEYVGEGKKFKDAAALAYSKAQSDAFITQLQREAAELREDLSKRKTMEEVLSNLQNTPNQPNGGNAPAGGSENNSSALDEETLNRLIQDRVKATIESTEAERNAKSNVELVKNTLVSTWGNDYVAKLEAASAELGLSKDFVTSLARTQPKVLLKLVGAEASQPRAEANIFSPSTAGVVSAGLTARNSSSLPEQEKYSYWQKMRTENPNFYHSPVAAKARFEAAKKHGEAFFKN